VDTQKNAATLFQEMWKAIDRYKNAHHIVVWN